METNNLFQNCANQNGSGNYFSNGNPNYYRYPDMNSGQSQACMPGFINRTNNVAPAPSSIPVRVVFSPEQIAPQEIPTNGTPALFPLSDGSRIIVKSLLGNGLFDERVYVLQPYNQQNGQSQMSEFDQVMSAIGKIEESLNKVLNDLYGPKAQTNKEGDAKNE